MLEKFPYMFGALTAGVFASRYYNWPQWNVNTLAMLEKFPYMFGALTAGVFASGYYNWPQWNVNTLLPISLVVGGISAAIFGAAVTVSLYIKLSPPHKVNINIPKEITALQTLVSTIDCSSIGGIQAKQDIAISRKVDAAINEIINCFIDSKITPWYSTLVHDATTSSCMLRNVLWHVIIAFHKRLIKVDHVRFVMCGLLSRLTHHLERIRLAEAAGQAKGERGVFHLSPQLSSPVRERNFLRLVAEFLIVRTFPPEYHKCTALRMLLKELIACRLFEPLIDRICNPSWINEHLLKYLRQQQVAEELGKRTYHYAASYEEFIDLIQDSSDISDLKHLRRNIINEIMQATAINNLKKAKGIDTSRETTPQSTGKGDLLQARNLKRYINQLTYAKAQCERRITILKSKSNANTGSLVTMDTKSMQGDGVSTDLKPPEEWGDQTLSSPHSLQNLPGRKILMFQVILDSAFARRYFAIYLDEIGKGSLLSFWSAVQELKQSDKRQHYQLGMEIYHTYLAPQLAPIKVDKALLRGVEAFLLGNRGPDILHEIGEEVERTLEDRHYTGFLVSSTYHAMLTQAQLQGIDFMSPIEAEACRGEKVVEVSTEADVGMENLSLQLSDHSTYARNKLAHLQERLTNKLLASQAIQQTKKADPKVILHLEGEIASIRKEHRQLEAHVERTALWSDHLGHWRVLVYKVEVYQEKEVPSLVLFVYLGSDSAKVKSPEFQKSLSEVISAGDPFTGPTLPVDGWVVVQKITQLSDLHRKLCQIAPWIKSIELPSNHTKLLFNKQLDKARLDKVSATSQNYFNVIMTDEKLQGSELIYAFLSPSPEHLKQIMGPAKKSRFSFSTLFKSSEGKSDCEDDDMGNLFMMDGASGESTAEGSDTAKDSVAEPLFAFLEELCELRGVGKWLRKTLVSFVQITYGKNITRHVRETVQGLLSESMVIYYLQTLRNSFWPEEELATPPPAEKTPEEAMRIRNEAQEQFVRNLPELLCTLVGQQNARHGAARLFCTLQHHALNKNLFYTAFEVVLKELFPELQDKLKKL